MRKIPKRRQGREIDQVLGGEVVRLELLAPAPGHPLPGAIEPMAFEGHAVYQGAGGMHPRPVQRTFDQRLLRTVLEYIAQPRPLHLGLVADDNSIVATRPQRSIPADESPHLARQVPLEVLHETR